MSEQEMLDNITGTILDCAIKVQLLSYLKLSGSKVGLLINFNVQMLKDGVMRLVNNFPDSLRS